MRLDIGICKEWVSVIVYEDFLGPDEESKSSRLGMCLSRCSFRVKLFPQYAQYTMVAQSKQ